MILMLNRHCRSSMISRCCHQGKEKTYRVSRGFRCCVGILVVIQNSIESRLLRFLHNENYHREEEMMSNVNNLVI